MAAFNNTNHSVINVDKLIYVDNLEFLASIDSNIRYTFEQVDIYIAIGEDCTYMKGVPLRRCLGDSKYDYEVSQRTHLDFIFIGEWSDFQNWQGYCDKHKITSAKSLCSLV